MSHEPEQNLSGTITFRMSIGKALATAAKFNFLIFMVVAILPMIVRWDATNFPMVLVAFGLLSGAFAVPIREVFKVSISPEGIGTRRRPIYWSEITEVERGGGFPSQWQAHATYQPSVIVVESIAGTDEFREAIERFSPEDSAIRKMIAGTRE